MSSVGGVLAKLQTPQALSLITLLAGCAGAFFVVGLVEQRLRPAAPGSLLPVAPGANPNAPPPGSVDARTPASPASTSGETTPTIPFVPKPVFQGPVAVPIGETLTANPGETYMISVKKPFGLGILANKQDGLNYAVSEGFTRVTVDDKVLPGWPGSSDGSFFVRGTFAGSAPKAFPQSKLGFKLLQAFRIA